MQYAAANPGEHALALATSRGNSSTVHPARANAAAAAGCSLEAGGRRRQRKRASSSEVLPEEEEEDAFPA